MPHDRDAWISFPHARTCAPVHPALNPAVPCLSRATELERYDPGTEFSLAGEEEGWVATHSDPVTDKVGAVAAAQQGLGGGLF